MRATTLASGRGTRLIEILRGNESVLARRNSFAGDVATTWTTAAVAAAHRQTLPRLWLFNLGLSVLLGLSYLERLVGATPAHAAAASLHTDALLALLAREPKLGRAMTLF